MSTETNTSSVQDASKEANRNFVAIISFIIFLFFFGQTMTTPIIGLYAVSVGGGIVDVGLIFLSNAAFASTLSIPFGSLSDRLGRRKTAFIGILLASISSFLLPQARNPYAIMVLYAIAGIGLAAHAPTLNAAIGDFAAKDRIATAYSWSQVGRSAAFTLGPAVGGALAGLVGFESTFTIIGGMQFTALIFGIIFLPKSRRKSSELVSQEGNSSLKVILSNASIVITMFTVFIVATGNGLFNSFFPLYGKGIGLTPFVIGGIFAFQAVTNASSRVIVARFSDRTGRRSLPLLVGFIGLATSISFAASFESIPFIIIVVGVLGTFLGICQLLQSAVMAENATPRTRGLTMGLFTTGLFAGIGLGPAVFGPVIESYGFDFGFKLESVVIIVGLLTFLIMSRRNQLR